MDRDSLNFFQPFEHYPPNHENQLTRALLIVLRMSPLAHEYWLSRLGTDRRLSDLPQAEFDTQKRAIAIHGEPEEPVTLVSVFLTPAATFDEDVVVAESDRKQVLDAIVTYPGELVVVVENKVVEADAVQAANINISGAAVKLAKGQKPVLVLWPELLADFTGILERDLVAGAEYDVLSDFLVYVEDHFPGLGPYRTLRLCARKRFRVDLRLRAVLSEALGMEARIDKWGPCCDIPDLAGTGTRAYLTAFDDMSMIEFSVFPADTLTQARKFYSRPEAVAAVRGLEDQDGWVVRHNFHFGHMESGYLWTGGDIDADSYIDLWTDEINDAGNIPREEWPEYFDWLVEKQIAAPSDREEFDYYFTDTKRATATPRPGLCVARQWTMLNAEALDGTGKLAPAVGDAYAKVIAELGS